MEVGLTETTLAPTTILTYTSAKPVWSPGVIAAPATNARYVPSPLRSGVDTCSSVIALSFLGPSLVRGEAFAAVTSRDTLCPTRHEPMKQ